jgi:MYXO-CTERM domain-containing protein
VTQGALADAAVGDAAGSVNAHLREIAKTIDAGAIALGQAHMASSLPVVIADNQTAISVACASADVNAPAANTAAVVTYAADATHKHAITGIAWSYAGGIPVGGAVSGFAVQFDWLGSGAPGAQPFDIVDPQTLQPLFSGTTVPEPAGLLLLALAGLVARRRN